VRILVTGSDGYIGSVLVPYLSDHGHDVVGLDTGYYAGGRLYNDARDRPRTLVRDIRAVTPDDLAAFEAVVHLAELSNDPLGSHNPSITFDINYGGSMHLARTARDAGVRRFVYASSCSVYGVGSDAPRTEESATAPQTPYAECKLLCEAGLAELNSPDFATTCLRNATAFGASPRMRFDIVLNNLSGLAWTKGAIELTSDGSPWRPLVHVLDICQAIELTLNAPSTAVGGQILNVGSEDQNYRIAEIAAIVGSVFPGCRISTGAPSGDNRSYRVAFDKIGTVLPAFRCERDAHYGARELLTLFRNIRMSAETFAAAPFTRLQELKRLAASDQLDGSFRWLAPFRSAVPDATPWPAERGFMVAAGAAATCVALP
jgi:nucleoside-diphosphate-sugar epimerase